MLDVCLIQCSQKKILASCNGIFRKKIFLLKFHYIKAANLSGTYGPDTGTLKPQIYDR